MPRKVFVAGEILTAADVNTNLMDQAVMVFDDASARTTAIPTPVEGMVTYLSDVNQVQAFTGSAFTPVGTILQILQTVKTNTETTSSGTFTAVSGLSVAITPSSTSSKILIMVSLYGTRSSTGAVPAYRITGGNAGTFIGDAGVGSQQRVAGSTKSADSTSQAAMNLTFLDSPATTSAVTYGVEFNRGSSGTAHIGRSVNNANDVDNSRTASTITVMEVAG